MKRRALLATIPLPLLTPWRAPSAATILDGEEVTLPAGPSGHLRWVAWATRGRMGRTVTLVLRKGGRAGEGDLWSDFWRDAYEPTLRSIPDWLHRGHPLVALTLRYGAGAQETVLLAYDGAGQPRRVAERLASAIEWRNAERGRTVLVAYGRDGSALVPSCFGWDGSALETTLCPSPSGR